MKKTLLNKILFSIGVGGVILIHSVTHASPLEPGKSAPSFSLPSVSGKRESLRIWCGTKLIKPFVNKIPHTVIVSFWATYCKPCMKEIPELQRYYEKHKNEHIKIFLINIDEKGAGIVVPFVKEKNYTLPVLFDPYKKTSERYGVKSLPALFVIGPDGIIRYSSVGYKKEISIEETLDNVIRAIKEGKNVAIESGGEQGESIEVQEDNIEKDSKPFSSKQKWHAVARIECGTSPDSVAAELNVPKEEIRKWYNELKETAIELWESE